MKLKKPFVTVLMCEYNTPLNQFEESINSILNQTYSDFELIIVDDCGKNNVKDFIKKFNDDRIKIIKNDKNCGLAISLNNGLKYSKGEYIVRMDTDDIAFPTRIEKQVDFILKNSEYSIVGTRHTLFDDGGEYGESSYTGEILKKDFLKGPPFCHPSLLIRKDDLMSIGGYPNYKRAQDYAMEMQMYYSGFKGYIMDDILLRYRQDSNSYRKRNFDAKLNEYKMRNKYFKLLKMPWYSFFYKFKPLIVFLIPNFILKMRNK